MIPPMLAKKYSDHGHKLDYPCFVQPKLNGVRMIYANSRAYSRDLHPWNDAVLDHILTPLRTYLGPSALLDGELYFHGWSLQKINSAIGVNRLGPNINTLAVSYHVFDIISAAPHSERLAWLPLLSQVSHTICPVATHLCHTPEEGDHYYSLYRRAGYEGLMYRESSAPYGLIANCTNKENRWPTLLKRKETQDAEFTVVSYNQEIDKNQQPKDSVGSFVFLTPSGAQFSAGSGLTRAQRQYYWSCSPVGLVCTVSFEMLSDTGIPLKPTISLIHDDQCPL